MCVAVREFTDDRRGAGCGRKWGGKSYARAEFSESKRATQQQGAC